MKLRKGGITAGAVKYSIVSLLSSHKDSVVWLAEHKTLHVKRIIKGILKTSPFHDGLVKEAHLLKNLNNPHIPKVFDLEEDDEYTYIIEEYIAGESLKSLTAKRLLSEKEIFHFIIQVCSIIDYLHTLPETLLFLDIKPENIIIAQDNCYLVDFGSAHTEGTEAELVFGTRSYASPEQMKGGRLSKETDIYALGKLLEYMVLHGCVSLAVKGKLETLIRKCTAKSIWGRFGSTRGLMAKIKEITKESSSFSEKPLRIAFAGAAPNTGTTYIALLFSAFLKNLGRSCIYVEFNSSEATYSISPRTRDYQALAGLEILSRKQGESLGLAEGYGQTREYFQEQAYGFTDSDIIADYGQLRKDMPEGFYEADFTCIAVGRSCWETDEITTMRALSRKCNKKLFLVNLTDTVSDETAHTLGTETFMAIPFIKNPNEITENTEVKSVLLELATRCGFIY